MSAKGYDTIYREIFPKPPFDQFVQCYWILEMNGNGHSSFEKVIPDGQMEMIFHYSDRYICRSKNGESVQPRSLLFGQLDRYIELRPTGKTGIFGVRFKTSGAAAFFKFPLQELHGSFVDIADLNPSLTELEDQLANAISTHDRIIIWEKHFLRRLNNYSHDPALDYAVQYITHETNGRIDELAALLNIGARHLTRKFYHAIGISPKHLTRISRIKRVVRQLASDQKITRVAYDAGYYDQAHFIKDFKKLVGCTPGQFRRQNHQLNDLFE